MRLLQVVQKALTRAMMGLAAAVLLVALVDVAGPLVADPATLLLGDSSTGLDLRALREQLGLEAPWYRRVASGLADLAHPDEVRSFWYGVSTAELVRERWRPTAIVAGIAVVVAVALGLLLGMLGLIFPAVTVFVRSLWTAILVLPLFVAASLVGELLTRTMAGGTSMATFGGVLLGVYGSIWYARTFLRTAREEFSSIYAAVDRALGLRGWHLWLRRLPAVVFHGLGILELQVALLFTGGTILIEYSLRVEGLGLLLLEAVLRMDLPVIRLLLFGGLVSYLAVATFVAFIRSTLDPRSASVWA